MNRAQYRASLQARRLHAHALREHASNPYLKITRHGYIQAELDREADRAWWTLPNGSCERERVEIERMRNRRQRVLELLRANARSQLRDSMAIFRAHPLRGARRLPDGGVL